MARPRLRRRARRRPAARTRRRRARPADVPVRHVVLGVARTGGAAGLPIDKLRGPGRAILHGEQAFKYHRWPKVGDVLEGTTVITDVYEKERSNGGKLEFYVTETEWKDAETGDAVVTSIFTLVINVRPPKTD